MIFTSWREWNTQSGFLPALQPWPIHFFFLNIIFFICKMKWWPRWLSFSIPVCPKMIYLGIVAYVSILFLCGTNNFTIAGTVSHFHEGIQRCCLGNTYDSDNRCFSYLLHMMRVRCVYVFIHDLSQIRSLTLNQAPWESITSELILFYI